MRRGILLGAACAALAILAGCGGEDEPAADTPPAAEVGVRPDSLTWFQEGRPVAFGGRLWRPVGEPIEEPASSFEAVGAYEGTPLYTVRGDDTGAHLFFPIGGDRWQTLEPIPAEADTAADTTEAGP